MCVVWLRQDARRSKATNFKRESAQLTATAFQISLLLQGLLIGGVELGQLAVEEFQFAIRCFTVLFFQLGNLLLQSFDLLFKRFNRLFYVAAFTIGTAALTASRGGLRRTGFRTIRLLQGALWLKW